MSVRLTFHSSSQGAVRWRGPEGPQNPSNLRGVTLVASSTFAERPQSLRRDHRAALPLACEGALQLSERTLGRRIDMFVVARFHELRILHGLRVHPVCRCRNTDSAGLRVPRAKFHFEYSGTYH